MISQHHRDLTEELLAWSLRACTCQRGAAWHAKRAFVASTFEINGAPPDAAPWENLLCAKYLVFFLGLDGGSAHEIRDLADRLRTGRRASGELGEMHRALLTDIGVHAASTARLETELVQLCAATSTETQPDAATMTWDEFHAGRLNLIGTHPYLTCWRSIRGLLDPQPDPETERLVECAVEATYLANDLASLEKETRAAEPVTSNSVRFRAQVSGDLNAAADAAVDRYNHIVELFRRTSPAPLIAILSGVIDGNVSSHLHLSALEYPGAAAALRRLLTITPTRT
ncbi:hypothetical protein ACIHFB_24645 [Streptomyces sp. NPDC051963]|uniref:terpene synthase family protein n=1 Tax=Streptomyces sp. NPDC051963 TaxID=3365678 RepID=UPI0037CE4379